MPAALPEGFGFGRAHQPSIGVHPQSGRLCKVPVHTETLQVFVNLILREHLVWRGSDGFKDPFLNLTSQPVARLT
jgi:hypothetical protein